jgi:uncharacterized protein YndB with AHSA1/START domain
VLSRVFDAPRELVWQAWTDPRHADQWWGPRGFTNTTHECDLPVGGVWRHTMHGPDGSDYPNRKQFLEVDPPSRLVYTHGWDRPGGELFQATITFTDLGGNRTEVEMRSAFPTAADRDKVVKERGAIEGGKQTLSRLGEYLAEMQAAPPFPAADAQQAGSKAGVPIGGDLEITLPTDTSIRITRSFAAPPELLYEVCTQPQHVRRWWGGCALVQLVSCEVDLRVGGGYRYVLRDPQGQLIGFHGEYRELVPGRRAVQTFVYEPYPDAEAVETAEYEAIPGGTRLTVTIEHKTQAARDGHVQSGMEHGLQASYAALDKVLTLAPREASTSRLIAAPYSAVYRALTTPALLEQWWGPAGFTNRFEQCDVRPGGHWKHVMRAPDGTEYPNESLFQEVEPDRVVIRHLAPRHDFVLTIALEDHGARTQVYWNQLFQSVEDYAGCVAYVPRCNEENLDRLSAVAASD